MAWRAAFRHISRLREDIAPDHGLVHQSLSARECHDWKGSDQQLTRVGCNRPARSTSVVVITLNQVGVVRKMGLATALPWVGRCRRVDDGCFCVLIAKRWDPLENRCRGSLSMWVSDLKVAIGPKPVWQSSIGIRLDPTLNVSTRRAIGNHGVLRPARLATSNLRLSSSTTYADQKLGTQPVVYKAYTLANRDTMRYALKFRARGLYITNGHCEPGWERPYGSENRRKRYAGPLVFAINRGNPPGECSAEKVLISTGRHESIAHYTDT